MNEENQVQTPKKPQKTISFGSLKNILLLINISVIGFYIYVLINKLQEGEYYAMIIDLIYIGILGFILKEIIKIKK